MAVGRRRRAEEEDALFWSPGHPSTIPAWIAPWPDRRGSAKRYISSLRRRACLAKWRERGNGKKEMEPHFWEIENGKRQTGAAGRVPRKETGFFLSSSLPTCPGVAAFLDWTENVRRKRGVERGRKALMRARPPSFPFSPPPSSPGSTGHFFSFLVFSRPSSPPSRQSEVYCPKSWAAREKRGLEDPPTQLHSKLSEEGGGKSEGKEGECYRKYIAGNASRA